MGRKKRPLPPRRLRMNRAGRLQSARSWLAKFTGKHVARAYSNWFGVNRPCAIKELQLLGVQLDAEYIRAVERTEKQKQYRKARTARRPSDDGNGFDEDSFGNFAYIAGYTPGGMPFGLTWDELAGA